MYFSLKAKTAMLIVLATVAVNRKAFSASDEIIGYNIVSGEKGLVVNCYDSDRREGDQRLCDQYSTAKNSSCALVPSSAVTAGNGSHEEVYICNPPGESYCFRDFDCQALGKTTCAAKQGSNIRFESQFDSEDDLMSNTTKIGICVSSGGNNEENAIGQAICNLIGVANGNAGRAVVGVVVIVVGIMFFLGKVTWSLVLAVTIGTGAIFGAETIVVAITGKPFYCRTK